jgi:SAM-dependent methyltransferase
VTATALGAHLRTRLAEHPSAWQTAKRVLALTQQPWLGLKRLRQKAEVRAYLNTHPDPRIILGAGPHSRPGWLSTDLVPRNWTVTHLDASRPFPFPDASIAAYYSEHMIEHIGFYAAQQMVREMRRTLRPSGRIRLATPSLDRIAGLAAGEPPMAVTRDYVRTANEAWCDVAEARFNGSMPVPFQPDGVAFVINRAFYGWGHRFLFDTASMRDLLSEAGFIDIRFREVGESDDPEFRGIEFHGQLIGDVLNRYETMVVEAAVACD